ncbi:MAG: DUF805 domain-containing protein [Bacteroides sp.]|nr:DUF805 domain-containing protein [Bacteroides sp.]MBD5346834.1 DUF805 domain-containing protein [Bacteroides sp.]
MLQRKISFKEAVVRALTRNYCNFNGRASRSEYWWFTLFTIILEVIISLVFGTHQTTLGIVGGLAGLALLLPGLGLCVRRLHDIGKSGWWILISLIPTVGAIILIIWFCKDSDPVSNAYGPVPNLEY